MMFVRPGRSFLFAPALFLALTPLLFPGPQTESRSLAGKSYPVRATSARVRVDGLLDEAAWRDAASIDVATEWMPGDNIPAPVKTEFLVTFDADFLYMAFRCHDPDASQIRAHLMDRDATDTLIQDDHISVMIDPFNDERRGFQFRVNPLGVQADANFSELEGYEDFSWDAIWAAAGRIEDWGYAVEIAIPFSQLRFPRTSGPQTWGVSPERSYPRSVRHRITSHPRRRDSNCILCQFDKLTGFQGMKTGLNMEFDPTFTANRTDTAEAFPDKALTAGKIKADPGLTFRWGITPNLVLNAALNPDFSQVEADVRELDVNRRFAIRYPEKRPFFLEGADFFLTPFEAVFTRTVADPDFGFKFTGKAGRHAFGVFGTSDRINNLLFPSNQGSSSMSLDDQVLGGVFRYRYDLGQGSALGALYTGRTSEGYANHVGGVDGFFRLSRTETFRFQYLRSETDYPDGLARTMGQDTGAFGGGGLLADFEHLSRDWMYGLTYTDVSPGFRTDFGYTPRADFRSLEGGLARLVWGKPGQWFTRLTVQATGSFVYDYGNRLTDRAGNLSFQYMGPLQSVVMLRYQNLRELYAGIPFDQNNGLVYGEIKPWGGLVFSATGMFGDAIDYANVRKSSSLTLSPAAEFGIGRHVNVNLRHSFQRLGYGGEEVFTVNLSQVRLIYNFNVRMFVRAVVQYMDLAQNPAQYAMPVSEKTNTVFTQFLFSYKLNPQTVLFLGYSDNSLGLTGIPTTRQNRTFFIKIGYAWLL